MKKHGFALISTLLVLAVLTIMAVGFLSAIRTERLTSKSYAGTVRARLAAEGGLEGALVRLKEADLASLVTTYQRKTVKFNGKDVDAPYLSALELKAQANLQATDPVTVIDKVRYLYSTTKAQTDFDATVTDLVDINYSPTDYGPIGLRDADGDRQAVPVPWQYLEDANGNKYARFAYWIDDESAKVNVMTAGGAESVHVHKDGGTAAEIALDDLIGAGAGTLAEERAKEKFQERLLTLPTALQIATSIDKKKFDENRSFLTMCSRADERGALGWRRLDINAFVNKATDYKTSSGRQKIVDNVQQMADWIKTGLPKFGERYYRSGVTTDDQKRYLYKIAANIHDYIDEDSQPTVITQSLNAWVDVEDPTNYAAPDNPPGVFGKEIVPNTQDYAAYYYPSGGQLTMDHTFEIWNIHSRPIDFSKLGTVSVLMANRGDIKNNAGTTTFPVAGSFSGSGAPVLNLSVPSNSTVSAGNYALMTTLGSANVSLTGWSVSVNGSSAPQNIALARVDTPLAYPGGPVATNRLKFFGDTSGLSDDCNTEVCIVNEYGYLDIQARLAQQASTTGNNLVFNDPFDICATSPFGNDGAASGANSIRAYPLDSGDPRSLTELWKSYDPNPGTSSPAATRRSTIQGTSTPPLAVTLGEDSLTNTYGINAANNMANGMAASQLVPEPELAPHIRQPEQAFSVIRDGTMRSIGELGHIYDPALPSDGYYQTDTMNRGGFRTLAIGTRLGESGYGPNNLAHVTATSRNKASLLLELFYADIGATADHHKGRLHLNSIKRDPQNLAWKALLKNLATQTNTAADTTFPSARDPSMLQGTAAAKIQTANLINAISNQTVSGPSNTTLSGTFLTLGSLAELPIFNSGRTLLDGVELTPTTENNNHLDRGREEVFRHISNLLCLKGSTYTIHVIGQAGRMQNGKFVLEGTSRLTATVDFTRTYPSTDPLADLTATTLSTNNKPTANSYKVLTQQYQ